MVQNNQFASPGRFHLPPTVLFAGDCHIALSGNLLFVPDWAHLLSNSGLYIYTLSALYGSSLFTIFIFLFPVFWSKTSILLLFAGFLKSDIFCCVRIFLYILTSSAVFFNQISPLSVKIRIVPDRDFPLSRYLLSSLK